MIQHYRDGIDYISEHSDKTLDIARGSKIVNVSLGAQRTMILRTKKDIAKSNDPKRSAQRIPLPHNSMFVLGLETNRKWLHGIRQDKRADTLKKPEEYAYNGERISLTFRHISTFLTPDEQEIYGQGATSKSKSSARKAINGETPEAEKLLEAFGSENHQSDFDWDATYGAGSDVLHLKEQLPKLFFLSDADGGGDVDTWRVKLCLHEKGIRVTPHELSSNDTASSSFLLLSPRGTTPVLTDVDRDKTVIRESLAIMQYLEMFYPPPFPNRWLLPSLADERSAFALVLQRMHESQHLAEILSRRNPQSQDSPEIVRELNIWDDYVRRSGGYVATRDDASLADLAAYPPIAKFLEREGWKLSPRWQNLAAWIAVMDARESVKATRPSG